MAAPSKVALVTGAARGIGLASAKRFLADGWRVALLDIDGDNLERAHAAIARPDETLALICDVAIPEQVARAFAELKQRFGRLEFMLRNRDLPFRVQDSLIGLNDIKHDFLVHGLGR